ncbi:MAG: hypothetical protein ACERK9_11685 [Deltaproteobacteria bacterium]
MSKRRFLITGRRYVMVNLRFVKPSMFAQPGVDMVLGLWLHDGRFPLLSISFLAEPWVMMS